MNSKLLFMSATLLLCTAFAARAEVINLNCEQTGLTEYKLTFAFTADTRAVDILASTDPNSAASAQTVLHTTNNSAVVNAGTPGQRMYFFLKPDHGATRETSIRHLPLQGTPNFRDIGGYETTEGKFVRWGLLYRSGVLTPLTASDYAYLTPLGIRVVCDFRTDGENKLNPEIWIPDASVDHLHLPIGVDSKNDVTSSLNSFLATHPSTEALRQHLIDMYGQFAFTNAPEYAKVFVQLKEDRLPLLYHCAGGKDRTGVFSAFVLLTLGVPEKTVIEDYELTNKFVAQQLSDDGARKLMASSGNSALAQLTPDQRKVLIAADPEYLRSTLRQIEARYGSFDHYRRTALGVSDDDVKTLKSRLLTN